MQIYLHSLLGLAKTVFMVLTKCNAPSECFLFFFGVGVDSAGGWHTSSRCKIKLVRFYGLVNMTKYDTLVFM